MEEQKIIYDIERMIREIQECMDRGNYFAALTTSLILPDICAEIEKGKRTTGKDYARWCDIWMHGCFPQLIFPIAGEEGWGKIIYKLRCGIMHNGEVDVSPRGYGLSDSKTVLFTLENFSFYLDTSGSSYRKVVNVDSEGSSGALGYNHNHKIAIEIKCFIQAIWREQSTLYRLRTMTLQSFLHWRLR